MGDAGPRFGASVDRRRTLITVFVTLCLLGSLATFASPTAAVETTLSGPDRMTKTETVAFDASTRIRTDERVPVDAFTIEFRPVDGADESDESVAVTFAADGTVLAVAPDRGTVGDGEIRIRRLERSLEVTPVRSAPVGYGDLTGYDERTGAVTDFGYGYGYSGSHPEFEYRISFDSHAFKRGQYAAHFRVETGEGSAFASAPLRFEVVLPSDGDDAADGDVHPGRGDDDSDDGGNDGDADGDADGSDDAAGDRSEDDANGEPTDGDDTDRSPGDGRDDRNDRRGPRGSIPKFLRFVLGFFRGLFGAIAPAADAFGALQAAPLAAGGR